MRISIWKLILYFNSFSVYHQSFDNPIFNFLVWGKGLALSSKLSCKCVIFSITSDKVFPCSLLPVFCSSIANLFTLLCPQSPSSSMKVPPFTCGDLTFWFSYCALRGWDGVGGLLTTQCDIQTPNSKLRSSVTSEFTYMIYPRPQ